jgi:hypothetical protein
MHRRGMRWVRLWGLKRCLDLPYRRVVTRTGVQIDAKTVSRPSCAMSSRRGEPTQGMPEAIRASVSCWRSLPKSRRSGEASRVMYAHALPRDTGGARIGWWRRRMSTMTIGAPQCWHTKTRGLS